MCLRYTKTLHSMDGEETRELSPPGRVCFSQGRVSSSETTACGCRRGGSQDEAALITGGQGTRRWAGIAGVHAVGQAGGAKDNTVGMGVESRSWILNTTLHYEEHRLLEVVDSRAGLREKEKPGASCHARN